MRVFVDIKNKEIECYLQASDYQLLEVAKLILKESNIHVIDASFSNINTSISQSIYEAVKQSHVAIFLIKNDSSLKELYFEIGIAVGLRKKVYILCDFDKKYPAKNTDGLDYIYLNLSDKETIRYALSGLLSTLSSKSRLIKNSKRNQDKKLVVSSRFKKEITDSLIQGDMKSALAFELAIAKLFKSLGASQVIAGDSPKDWIDLVVWLDDVEHSLGNPLLVELKTILTHRSVDQLRKLIHKKEISHPNKPIFLIYGKSDEKTIHQINNEFSDIIPLNVFTLLTELKNKSLAEILTLSWKSKISKRST